MARSHGAIVWGRAKPATHPRKSRPRPRLAHPQSDLGQLARL